MASPSPPLLLFVVTAIKLAFCNMLSCFWPCPDATSPHVQKSLASLTVAQLTCVTRIRSYGVLRCWRSWSDDRALDFLPVYLSHSQIETQFYQSKEKGTLNLGKTIVSLTFQAVFGMTLAATPGQGDHRYQPHFLALYIVGVAMEIAFAACLSGIFLRQSYPKVASIFETIGSAFAAFGFFLMASIFLSQVSSHGFSP